MSTTIKGIVSAMRAWHDGSWDDICDCCGMCCYEREVDEYGDVAVDLSAPCEFLNEPRAAAASMKTVSTSASVAAALPAHRAFRRSFAAELRLRARVSPIGEWRLRRRFRNRLINRETLCVECARRVLFGFRRKRTLCPAHTTSFSQPPCFEAPFTSASMCFDTMKSFCRCASKGLP